jgi:8-oxo-dGTP diphosphatase
VCSINEEESRRFPSRPLLGVGALIFRGGEVLIVERGTEPLKGYWSIPGGLLEVGEKLVDGIRREVREETGLDVEPLYVFEIFERIMPDADGKPEYHYVLIDYVCRLNGGELVASSDVSTARWVAEQNLPEYRLTEGTRAVLERAFNERNKLRTPGI